MYPCLQRDQTDRIPTGMLVLPRPPPRERASGDHEITSTNSPSLVIASPSQRGFSRQAFFALPCWPDVLAIDVRDGGNKRKAAREVISSAISIGDAKLASWISPTPSIYCWEGGKGHPRDELWRTPYLLVSWQGCLR